MRPAAPLVPDGQDGVHCVEKATARRASASSATQLPGHLVPVQLTRLRSPCRRARCRPTTHASLLRRRGCHHDRLWRDGTCELRAPVIFFVMPPRATLGLRTRAHASCCLSLLRSGHWLHIHPLGLLHARRTTSVLGRRPARRCCCSPSARSSARSSSASPGPHARLGVGFKLYAARPSCASRSSSSRRGASRRAARRRRGGSGGATST